MRACLLAGKNLQHACAAVDAGGGKRADVGAAVQNGLLFGLPVVLDTDSEEVVPGDRVLLKYQGHALAVFTCDSKWAPNKPLEAKHCYATTSIEHPAVQMIAMERGKYYIGACCGYPPAQAFALCGSCYLARCL